MPLFLRPVDIINAERSPAFLVLESTLIRQIINNLFKLNNSNHIFLLSFMALGICRLVCLFALLTLSLAEEQPTNLIYFVEYEVEQEDDYIEVTLSVESRSRVLTDALSQANITATEVANLAKKYCQQSGKKVKGGCEDTVEISQFQIQAKYEKVRKQASFSTFVVNHEVTINVHDTDSIGYLIDAFLKYKALTIEGFQWLPYEEVDSEDAAIKEGLEQGERLCKKLGLTLGQINGIEEIVEQQEEPQGEEQEEQEEGPEIVTYKFEVQCIAKKGKAK